MSFWRAFLSVSLVFGYFSMFIIGLAFPSILVGMVLVQLIAFTVFCVYQIYKRGFRNCLRYLISEDK